MCAGARFYPSRCGGHKNSGNVATFPEFLGRRKNLASACNGRKQNPPARAETGKELFEFQMFAGEIGVDARDLLFGGIDLPRDLRGRRTAAAGTSPHRTGGAEHFPHLGS